MNLTRFSEAKTGSFMPIATPTGPDHAFIPESLPPKWEFPHALWPKLVQARAALSKLDGIGQTLPDPELLLSPLKRREAITSSRIEGTYATAQELMLFELSQSEPKSTHDPVNSWKEVYNYSTSLSEGATKLRYLPFCGRLIKELHKTLMSGVRGQRSNAGEYRDHQVAIGSDRRYVPPPVPQMIEAMNNLEFYINEENPIYDPLVRAYLVHYQFEAIHPFGDGNGRIGRVLLSLMIYQWCSLSLPWLYMSSYFERFKDEYVDNLFNVSASGSWDKWIDFCLTGTIQQANDAISRCEKLGKLKAEMLDKIRPGSPRSEQIIHDLFSHPVIRVAHLAKKLNITYPTSQSDVDRLVDAAILKQIPDLRPKAYYSPEIFDIAYAESE